MRAWSVGLWLSLGLCPESVAQTKPTAPSGPAREEQPPEPQREAARRSADGQYRASIAVSEASTPGYQLVLESTSKDKTAAASAAWQSHDGSETYEMKLSGPIGDEPTSEAELLTLDGLPKSTKATFTFQKSFWRYRKRADGINPQDVVCKLAGIPPDGDCDPSKVTEAGKPATPRTFDARAAFNALTPAEQEVACAAVRTQIGGNCTAQSFQGITLYAPMLSATQFVAAPTFFGISATVGRKRYEYLTEDALEDRSANHNNWSASAYLSRYYSRAGLFLARVTYKDAWSDAQDEPEEVCRPIEGNADSLHCKTVSIGEPQNRSATTASFEWRRFLREDLALNPRVTYSFAKEYWQLELPVYFLKGGKGLTGGARLGWRSDKKEVTFGVFVGGSALSII